MRPRERVLAAAVDSGDRWWVGTDRALHHPAPADASTEAAYACLPWQRIDKAEWDREAEVLRLTRTAPFGEPMPVTVVHLPDPGQLLPLLRERVTASIVVSQPVPLRGEASVRVMARRAPHTDDPLEWSLAFDEGLDPADPAVRSAAERALADVRAQVEA